MFHQSRNRRTLCSHGKIFTRCRLALLGVISPLIVLMSAGLPATAQPTQMLGFTEAHVRGAVFETVANPSNCLVEFLPDDGLGSSVLVQIDCGRQPPGSHNTVDVSLFSRMLLNPPWVVAQVVIPTSGVQVLHQPQLGTRDLKVELNIDELGGSFPHRLPVFLRIAPTGNVTKPICPINRIRPNGSLSYTCSRNADCSDGLTCSLPCGFCTRSPFTEPPNPRAITVGEMRDLGYGVEPRTGDDHATFRVIWEGASRDLLTNRCPVSFDNGRTADESVVAVLNCRRHPFNGASATFDMFNRITLNPPWIVDAASVTQFDVDRSSNVDPSPAPAAGSNTVFQRVRINVATAQGAKAAVSIRIKPVMPEPLPNCQQGEANLPAICTTDADCPSPSRTGHRVGGGPLGGMILSASSSCSVACGNRCVRP